MQFGPINIVQPKELAEIPKTDIFLVLMTFAYPFRRNNSPNIVGTMLVGWKRSKATVRRR